MALVRMVKKEDFRNRIIFSDRTYSRKIKKNDEFQGLFRKQNIAHTP